MTQQPHDNILTIISGGAAGDGVRAVGSNLVKFIIESGYEAFASIDYPSLIRGGHNFSRMSFSNEKVFNDYAQGDILIAFNKETIQLHREELREDALILADKFTDEEKQAFGDRAIEIPMNQYAKEVGAPAIARSSVALGALCFILDLSLDKLEEMLKVVFKNKKEDINIKLANLGYEHVKANGIRHERNFQPNPEPKEALNGSETYSEGMVKAGLDYFVAYPMTPSSPILHYLAAKQKEFDIKIIHPESELSVINMALGIIYAGKRAAIGTAGGGFALMHEPFSFAGVGELPLLTAVVMRQAPASGVPTYTSQADLLFTVFAGHGEFSRIVILPGDPEEAYLAGGHGLNLAWKYQTPVVVLTDKHIAESVSSGRIDREAVGILLGKYAENTDENYGRYAFSDDGISPMAFPGTPNTNVKVTSYEHDEKGITIEDADMTVRMQDKRFLKVNEIKKEFSKLETVKFYGDLESKDLIVFWGSTKGAVLEAAKYLNKPVKLMQIVWAEPMNTDTVKGALEYADNIIDVEGNHDAQMAQLIKKNTGIDIEKRVLQYDARPFDPLDLAGKINDLLN
ncbi:MAG: 2-oxoacid:acceptor oxidoreductase subunit alpha [Candidatus Pacebacteria bacterium]|nr:2-oxoacid:acceptor oxidoreductase subunit alpha [Candidatus Paceibacterota bacterium]